jgi:hypothetical protein
MRPIKPSKLFEALGIGDPDMETAREWVTYKRFEEAVPDLLTLEEFVTCIYKKVVSDDSKPHRWFSERYLTTEYFHTDIDATREYISEFLNNMLVLQQRIDRVKYKHLVEFIRLVVVHLGSEKKVLPKQVLEFLNKIHKTKGNLDDTYK